MKKIRYFTIFSGVLLFSPQVFAQNFERQNNQPLPFFMPTQETAPKYEKLPPIRNNHSNIVRKKNTLYEVKYVLVDGVYVPTYTEKVITAPKRVEEELSAESHPDIIDDEPMNTSDDSQTSDPLITSDDSQTSDPLKAKAETNIKHALPKNSLINPPTYQVALSTDPDYTKIYDQYIADTLVFQKDKTFPYNKKLETSLNKMKSNKQIVVFKGLAK